MRARALLSLAAAAGCAALLPASVSAGSLTVSESPTTAGAASTETLTIGASKALASMTIGGEHIRHHGAPGTPPDGTVVGSLQVNPSPPLCSGSSSYDLLWVAPDPGSGAVAQMEATNVLNSFPVYVVEDSSGYQTVLPRIPTTAVCARASTFTVTFGSSVHVNPSPPGTYSLAVTLTYTDNSTDSLSATYVTT